MFKMGRPLSSTARLLSITPVLASSVVTPHENTLFVARWKKYLNPWEKYYIYRILLATRQAVSRISHMQVNQEPQNSCKVRSRNITYNATIIRLEQILKSCRYLLFRSNDTFQDQHLSPEPWTTPFCGAVPGVVYLLDEGVVLLPERHPGSFVCWGQGLTETLLLPPCHY